MGNKVTGQISKLLPMNKTAPLAPPPAPPPVTAKPATAKPTATDTLKLTNNGLTLPAAAVAPATAVTAEQASTDPAKVKAIQDQIKAILGPGVSFTTSKSTWTVGDSQGVLDAVNAMSAKDRASLKNATFSRVDALPPNPGSTKPNYGELELKAIDYGGPLTIELADVAAKEGVIKEVAAHEIGHAVMGGGRWDANMLREFAKLSHWTHPDGTMVNGYDKDNMPVDFEVAGTEAKGKSNLISAYSSESAGEDFAESYRTFVLHPDELMAKAPDKFLYLNSQSGKYTAAEAQAFAAKNGVDLPITMAELKRSNLRPETLTAMAASNGLGTAGDTGSAAGDAIAAIQAGAGDATFEAKLKANPKATLGDAIWNRLSTSEQALLSKPAYLADVLNDVKANKAATVDSVTTKDVETLKAILKDLINTPVTNGQKLSMTDEKLLGFSLYKFGDTPNKAPDKARFDFYNNALHNPKYWNQLSPAMQAKLNSPAGQAGIYKTANDPNLSSQIRPLFGGLQVKLLIFGTKYIGGAPDPKVKANINKAIDRMGPAETEAYIGLLTSPNTDMKKFGEGVASLAKNGYMPTVAGPGM